MPDAPSNFVTAAPFVPVVIEAAAGDSVAVGERTSFSQWDDAPASPRSRLVVMPTADVALNAAYGGTEYQLRVDLSGGVNGVAPGSLETTPASEDLWFAPGTDVTLTATAQTGFGFLGWTGDLDGEPNPVSVTMATPVLAGADFELLYDVADVVVDLVATLPANLQLQAANGSSPVTWQIVGGNIPLGLVFAPNGTVTGMPLDLGAYPLQVRATDALGLTSTATLTLNVAAPALTIRQSGNAFLLGNQPLDPVQEAFLDRQGNRNGSFDLGDFRAWVLANPSLPLSAQLSAHEAVASPRVITLPMHLTPEEASR